MKKPSKPDFKSPTLSAAMKHTSAAMALGSKKVSMIGAAAGAGIDIVSATRDERGYLSELAKEYRPEIAERLGLAENQVTEQDYHKAFAENPILAQAKQVSQMSGAVRVINTTIAVGVGVLAGLAGSIITRRAQSGGKQADAANIAGGTLATLAAAGAGKMVRKVLHTRKLDDALKETAHNKIMDIKGKQQQGEATTAADIFLVQLALNPDLDAEIQQVKGLRFQEMQPEQQMEVLRTEFPNIHEANTEMARLINEKGMRPQQLVFGVVRNSKEKTPQVAPMAPGHPDLPPNAGAVPPLALEASGAAAAGKALLDELNRGEDILNKDKEPGGKVEEGAKDGMQASQPPVTPRSETPPEHLHDKQPSRFTGMGGVRVRDGHEQREAGQEEKYSRAKLALQEGQETAGHAARLGMNGQQRQEGYAGRLDTERGQQPVTQR